MKWILLLLLPVSVYSQGLGPTEKDFTYPEFRKCGLVTKWASNQIPPECLTDALNVYFDEDLSVYRRRGTSQYNVTPCTDSRAIKGLWNYDAVDGQKYIVIHSSQSFFYTKNQGDCVAITGANSLNASAEYECVQALGKIWCVNGVDPGFSWDGATYSSYTVSEAITTSTESMPLGNKIGTFRNRLVISGVSGKLTRILLSGEGDGTDWVLKIPGVSTSPSSIDISGLNDGNAIKALMGQYQNAFYIGRDSDLWALSGNDRRDFTLRQVSSQVGVMDSRSVKEKDNCLVWLSRRGVEKLCGTTISPVSYDIEDIIKPIIESAGNTRTKTYDTSSEWTTGSYALSGGEQALSTTIYAGSIVPSTWGVVENSSTSWGAGSITQIDTVTVRSSFQLATFATGYLLDDFSNNDYVTGPVWYEMTAPNYYSAATGELVFETATDGATEILYTTNTMLNDNYTLTGTTITFDALTWGQCAASTQHSSARIDTSIFVVADSTDTSNTNAYALELGVQAYRFPSAVVSCPEAFANLVKYTNGTRTVLDTQNPLNYYRDSTSCQLRIGVTTFSITNNGTITVVGSGDANLSMTAEDPNPLTTSKFFMFYNSTIESGYSHNAHSEIDDINYYNYKFRSTGAFTSQIFDTKLSTPIGGPFSFTEIVPSGSTTAYNVRESTYNNVAGMGAWNVVSSTTSDEYRIPLTKRFWQYKADLSTDYSTQTPSVQMVGLEATSTGYYVGCVETSSVTSWGNFRPSLNIDGNASLSYSVSTGASCNAVTRSTTNWIAQNANSPIATSTSSFLGFRIYEQPTSSTETLNLGALTIEWNEGANRPPVASIMYKHRYYLFYTTGTNSGAYNEHALVLDRNDKWSLLDELYVYSATVYENELYTGDSRNTGFINIQNVHPGIVDSTYTFRIKTNDYDFGNPVELKKLKRIYLTLKSEETSLNNISLTVRYYIDGSTTPYSLSSVNLGEAREEGGYFVAKFPAINSQPTTFHWLKIEVEDLNGSEGPVNLHSIKVIYSPLRWE